MIWFYECSHLYSPLQFPFQKWCVLSVVSRYKSGHCAFLPERDRNRGWYIFLKVTIKSLNISYSLFHTCIVSLGGSFFSDFISIIVTLGLFTFDFGGGGEEGGRTEVATVTGWNSPIFISEGWGEMRLICFCPMKVQNKRKQWKLSWMDSNQEQNYRQS